MAQNSNKTSAFLIGAAIGSVAALMLAPFSGKKMRRLTAEKAKKAAGEAKKKYSEFERESLKPGVEKAKVKGKELWEKTRNKADEKMDGVKDRVDDARELIADKAEDVRNGVGEKVSSVRSRLTRRAKDEQESES